MAPDTFRLYAELGNTALRLGLWRGGWVLEQRVWVRDLSGPGGWPNVLSAACDNAGLRAEDCESVLACASSMYRALFEQAVHRLFGVAPRVLGVDVQVPIRTQYDDPATLGQDRLLAAYAAANLAGTPCLAVDAGTYITCDAVSDTGELLPIAIAPGLGLVRAGADTTAPHIAPLLHEALAGGLAGVSSPATSTEGSLRTGLAGYLGGTVDRLLDEGARALGGRPDVPAVLTGGDGALVLETARHILRHEPMLALNGLRELDGLNEQQ